MAQDETPTMKSGSALSRLLTHCGMGLALGAGLALFLLATDTGRIYSMITRKDGSLSDAFHLVLGFGLIIGVGASITGYIFDELERS